MIGYRANPAARCRVCGCFTDGGACYACSDTLKLIRAFSQLVTVGKTFTRRVTVAEVQGIVSARFGIHPSYMHSSDRRRDVARPRQVAMYLVRQKTRLSLPQIGRAFGGRDHTTVMHACRLIEKLCAEDADLDAKVKAISADLLENGPTVRRIVAFPMNRPGA